jgi:predicted dehydrogenase
LKAAEKYDRPLLVAYMHKWNHYNQKARQLVKDKRIGELCSISAHFGFLNMNLDKWRLFREKSGPGALGDLGIYAISTAMDIFEEMPVSCSAKAYPAGSDEYGDKFLCGRVNFSNGRWLQIDTSFLQVQESCGYTIIGTEGAIHVEGSWFQSGDGDIALCKGNNIELLSEEVVNPYEQELICFKECLDGKPVPSIMSIETAYKDIKVMGALDKSAALMGKEVAII